MLLTAEGSFVGYQAYLPELTDESKDTGIAASLMQLTARRRPPVSPAPLPPRRSPDQLPPSGQRPPIAPPLTAAKKAALDKHSPHHHPPPPHKVKVTADVEPVLIDEYSSASAVRPVSSDPVHKMPVGRRDPGIEEHRKLLSLPKQPVKHHTVQEAHTITSSEEVVSEDGRLKFLGCELN